MTLKEKYWENGNIFEFNTGEVYFVWGNNLINTDGYLSTYYINDSLTNIGNTLEEYVISVYSPYLNAEYFNQLLYTCEERLLWERSKHIFTIEEIKERLNIPKNEELIIRKG